MKYISTILFILMICSCGEKAEDINRNSILYTGGSIITMEGNPGETVESVVTVDDKIVFSGAESRAKELYPSAEIFNLEGKTMMPGFIEQHLHPFLGALTLIMQVIAPETWVLPDKTWESASNAKEYREKLVEIEKAMTDPDEILMSWGYHHNFHGPMSRQLLDSISSSRPILVWHRSVHEFYLNTVLLDQLDLNPESIGHFNDQVKSQINLEDGHFYEVGAMFALLPKIYPIIG